MVNLVGGCFGLSLFEKRCSFAIGIGNGIGKAWFSFFFLFVIVD